MDRVRDHILARSGFTHDQDRRVRACSHPFDDLHDILYRIALTDEAGQVLLETKDGQVEMLQVRRGKKASTMKIDVFIIRNIWLLLATVAVSVPTASLAVNNGDIPGPRMLAATPELTVSSGLGDVRLPEGELVVVKGQRQLRDGAGVKVLEGPPEILAEILRGGIQGVDRGLLEAGADPSAFSSVNCQGSLRTAPSGVTAASCGLPFILK